MKSQTITTRSGETLTLYQHADGRWLCPVCGSPELGQAPYLENGAASFEMCSCGFEFGFDDDPGASATALSSVVENLERWRSAVAAKHRGSAEQLAALRLRLKSIGVTNV